ncbi:hypothetical protein AXX12_13960 [Anaerosporomusa subterranea]|uniref:Uncharacterized protein n=1 Tax=Anaerosporomusa subterranea TaxID=1794912 RepID=A0A154BN33_ANASB|nr:hypothetical protein AXX12_13960 [Anaerosporomusa subterranea]
MKPLANKEIDRPTEILMETFLEANQVFLRNEAGSIKHNVSERSFCAQMMRYLKYEIDKTNLR